MAVYEVGVISRAGLPVIHIDFRPGVSGDPIMTAGFLTALQQFVKTAFSDDIRDFTLEKFSIYFAKTELMSEEECSVYVICERKKGEKAIQDRLANILRRVRESFFSLDDPDIGNSEAAMEFKDFIKKEFEDLKLRPAERAKKLFG
ncbi:MAG: hypothetical protein ACFFE8_10125 [Candidatus Heimdallarchaeota archaeon]